MGMPTEEYQRQLSMARQQQAAQMAQQMLMMQQQLTPAPMQQMLMMQAQMQQHIQKFASLGVGRGGQDSSVGCPHHRVPSLENRQRAQRGERALGDAQRPAPVSEAPGDGAIETIVQELHLATSSSQPEARV